MFGISGAELLIILVFGFIIFGPDKLPQIAKTVGTAISKFKEVQAEAKETLNVKDVLTSEDENAINDTIDSMKKLTDKAVETAKSVASDSKEVVDELSDSLSEKKKQYDEMREKRKSESQDKEE